MDLPAAIAIGARPFLALLFLYLFWCIKKVIWHILGPTKLRDFLYKKRYSITGREQPSRVGNRPQR